MEERARGQQQQRELMRTWQPRYAAVVPALRRNRNAAQQTHMGKDLEGLPLDTPYFDH